MFFSNEQSTTSPSSSSIFELSQASTHQLDSGLDTKSNVINSNDNSTVLEETSKESASDVTDVTIHEK